MQDLELRIDERPSRRPGLVAVAIDGETIVVDEDRARLHHLDTLAAAVWEGVDGQKSLGQVCAALAKRFDVDLQRVQTDVLALTERLITEGLLRRDQTC